MSADNKYASILRTYTTRNFAEQALTVGSDVVIPAGSLASIRVVPEFSGDVNPETNFLPRRIGVFSNFADGLVLKTPANRIDVSCAFNAYNYAQAYTLGLTYGSKAVTVSSGTSGWSAGNTYTVEITVDSLYSRTVVMLIDATGAATGNLRDYWCYDATGNNAAKNLSFVSADTFYTHKNISALNCMYDINEFAEPFQFSGAIDYEAIALRVVLNFDPAHTTEFLTDIIDTAFNGEKVFFDVVTEIEFTGKQ